MPAPRRSLALAVALLVLAAGSASAQMKHGGVPERLAAGERAGPWLVSVWAKADVGMGMVYAVYDAPAGAAFVAPTRVRIAVAPVSGRLPETVYEATAERVAHGARFVAHPHFDRDEAWRVRVLSADLPATEAVVAQVDVPRAGGVGAFGVLLYTLPVTLIAGLWARAAVVRRGTRNSVARRTALAAH